MKSFSDYLITIGPLACFLACIGDFIVTFILGSLYDGYHFIDKPESYLGTSDSPVAIYMNIWCVLYCLLLVIFALWLRKALPPKIKWSVLAFWLVILYALGEGFGSGIFPYNHIGTELTLSGKLHNLFGGIGMTALVFLPLVATRIYTKGFFVKLHVFSIIIFFSGLFFVLLSMLSKTAVIPFRGLWQRIFLMNYYVFFMVLAVVMKKSNSLTQT